MIIVCRHYISVHLPHSPQSPPWSGWSRQSTPLPTGSSSPLPETPWSAQRWRLSSQSGWRRQRRLRGHWWALHPYAVQQEKKILLKIFKKLFSTWQHLHVANALYSGLLIQYVITYGFIWFFNGLNIEKSLTKNRVSTFATALLSRVPRWSPTPANSIPNMGIPTRA